MGHLMVSISLKKMKTFLALLVLGFLDLGLATTISSTSTTTSSTTSSTTTTTTATDDSGDTNRPFVLCSYAKNDIGTCECPGQFFIADECHKGFFCMDFTDGNFLEELTGNVFPMSSMLLS